MYHYITWLRYINRPLILCADVITAKIQNCGKLHKARVTRITFIVDIESENVERKSMTSRGQWPIQSKYILPVAP